MSDASKSKSRSWIGFALPLQRLNRTIPDRLYRGPSRKPKPIPKDTRSTIYRPTRRAHD